MSVESKPRNSKPTTDRGGIQQAIRALRADGWTLEIVHDGGELIPVATEPEALDAICAVDMATLRVVRNGERGSVFFVLGNSPEEVVCDYTTNLTALDRLMDGWM